MIAGAEDQAFYLNLSQAVYRYINVLKLEVFFKNKNI